MIDGPIISPCIKTCTLDAPAALCLGCGRTVDEITRWSALNDRERARVMAELAGRLPTIHSTATASAG